MGNLFCFFKLPLVLCAALFYRNERHIQRGYRTKCDGEALAPVGSADGESAEEAQVF